MINQLKKLAAEKAVEEISSGMIVGLGSGTTIQYAFNKISEKIKNGELKDIMCIPSSANTEREAVRLDIPLISFDEAIQKMGRENKLRKSEVSNPNPKEFSILNSQFLIDVTIDGADEVTVGHPERSEGTNVINLIKGGGGALLREKVLAQASKKNIIVVDESKLSKHLGMKWHVPVEVIQFAVSAEKKYLESLGAKVQQRKNADGSHYITDENNFILDANFGEIINPGELSVLLNQRAGIVEHGLFIGTTSKLICAMSNGKIRIQNAEIRSK